MNNFSILKYILLSFAAVTLLNTNVAAEHYVGAEGGYALYDDMDEARQELADETGRTISSPDGAGGARAFIGIDLVENFALELGGFWHADVNFSGRNVDVDVGVAGGEATIVFKPEQFGGLFVRAGGQYSKAYVRGDVLGVSLDGIGGYEESGMGYVFGVGYDAPGLISDDSSIRVAYTRYGALGGPI
jgi:hypothetical protein